LHRFSLAHFFSIAAKNRTQKAAFSLSFYDNFTTILRQLRVLSPAPVFFAEVYIFSPFEKREKIKEKIK